MEEAETKIRQTVKFEYFSGKSKRLIDEKIYKIISEIMRKIYAPALRDAAQKSLLQFYNNQYSELQRSFEWQMLVLGALLLLSGKRLNGEKIYPTNSEKQRAIEILDENGYDGSRLMGTPLRRFSQEYINKYVRPALYRLAEQEAIDPDDVSGRNSLRNRAEMEVRYQANINSIADLRARGVRLVIASVHADCSKRCGPWQGRVYSLDGSRGTTDDGRAYVPLEEATDVYYTTKAGKTYKNGLLGFNCRHYLVEYRTGRYFPKPNPTAERREYEITQEQRRLERQVRKWRIRAVESKGQDEQEYKKARLKALQWNKAYIEFSKNNNRAYYPSRTKIL